MATIFNQPQVDASGSQTNKILSPRLVSAEIGLSTATIWRMRRAGMFPDPIQLSPGRVGYRATAIQQWLQEREAKGRG